MVLTSALVLSLISLIYATPHDYGGSHVRASAGAVAGAFSGSGVFPENVKGGSGAYSSSYSKSSASSFASSSASSSSSSFSFSGSGSHSGIDSNGLYGDNGLDGCASGNCANGNGNEQKQNGYGGSGSGAGAVASAGAFAAAGSAIPFSDGSKEPSCVGTNCNPITSTNKCTSGDCDNNDDIQINSHYKPKIGTNAQSSNLPNKNTAEKGSICTSGTCGPFNSEDHSPHKPNAHNTHPSLPSKAPAQWSTNSGAYNQQFTNEQETSKENILPNCANGICGNSKPLYEGPSSYNVPIQPVGTLPGNNCKNGDCATIPKLPYNGNKPKPNIPRDDISSCISGDCNKESVYENTNPVFTSSVPKKGPQQVQCSSPGCDSHLGPSSTQNHPQAESPKPFGQPSYSSFNPSLPSVNSPIHCSTPGCDFQPRPSNPSYTQSDRPKSPYNENTSPNCNNGNCIPVIKPIQSNYNPIPAPQNEPGQCSSPGCPKPGAPNTPISNEPSGIPEFVPLDQNVPPNCFNGDCKPVVKPIQSNYNPVTSAPYVPFPSISVTTTNCVGFNCPKVSPTFSQPQASKPALTAIVQPYNPHLAPLGPQGCRGGNCGPKPSFGPPSAPLGPQGCSNGNCGPKPSLGPLSAPLGPQGCSNGNCGPNPSFEPPSASLGPQGCSNGNCGPKPSFGPPAASLGPQGCSNGNCGPKPSFGPPAASLGPQGCSNGNCGPNPSFEPPSASLGPQGCSNGNCGPKPSFGPPAASLGPQGCSNGNCGPKPSFGPPAASLGPQGCSNGNCGPKPSFGPPAPSLGPQGCSNGNCGPKPSFGPPAASLGPQGCSNGNCGPKPSFGPPAASLGPQGCSNGNCGPKPSFGPPAASVGPQGCSNGNCGPNPSFGPPSASLSPQGCSNGNCGPKPTLRPQACTSGNCGNQPSQTKTCVSGSCSSNPIPSGFPESFVNPNVGLPKPVPNKEEKTYTGGFGAPSGILKPNDFSKPSTPFVPVSNPTDNKLISKPLLSQPSVSHTPPKTITPSLANPNKHFNHLASSISSAGAFASANSVAYTGGFGGPPGLLKPYDGKAGALTSGDKKHVGPHTGNNQGPFETNLNGATSGATAGAAAGSFSGAFNGAGQGGQDKSANCNGDKCNSTPSGSGNHPSNDGNHAFSVTGSFSGSGVGSYGQGHPGGDNGNSHSVGCDGGCGGNVKGGHQSGAYGLGSAGALAGAGAGAFGTSGSFATSSAVAHASAGATVKGGYGRR